MKVLKRASVLEGTRTFPDEYIINTCGGIGDSCTTAEEYIVTIVGKFDHGIVTIRVIVSNDQMLRPCQIHADDVLIGTFLGLYSSIHIFIGQCAGF